MKQFKNFAIMFVCFTLFGCNSGDPGQLNSNTPLPTTQMSSSVKDVGISDEGDLWATAGLDTIEMAISLGGYSGINNFLNGLFGLSISPANPDTVLLQQEMQALQNIQQDIQYQTSILWSMYISTSQNALNEANTNLINQLNVVDEAQAGVDQIVDYQGESDFDSFNFSESDESGLFNNPVKVSQLINLFTNNNQLKNLDLATYYFTDSDPGVNPRNVANVYLKSVMDAAVSVNKANFSVLVAPVPSIGDNADESSTTGYSAGYNAYAAVQDFYIFADTLNTELAEYLVKAQRIEALAIDLYYSNVLSTAQQQALQTALPSYIYSDTTYAEAESDLQTNFNSKAQNLNTIFTNYKSQVVGLAPALPTGTWNQTCIDYSESNLVSIPENQINSLLYWDGVNTLRTQCQASNQESYTVTERYAPALCGGAVSPVSNMQNVLFCSQMSNLVEPPTDGDWISNLDSDGAFIVQEFGHSYTVYASRTNSNPDEILLNGKGNIVTDSNGDFFAHDGEATKHYPFYFDMATSDNQNHFFIGYSMYVNVYSSVALTIGCYPHDLNCTQQQGSFPTGNGNNYGDGYSQIQFVNGDIYELYGSNAFSGSAYLSKNGQTTH